MSDDRYQQVKGNTFANYRWSIPLKDYQEINGHKLASNAKVIWHMPKGEFVYAHYHVSSLACNVQKFSA